MSHQIHILTEFLHTVKEPLVLSIQSQCKKRKKTTVYTRKTLSRFKPSKPIPTNSYMGAGANDPPRSTAETVFIQGAL